jgi:hypothetical protein
MAASQFGADVAALAEELVAGGTALRVEGLPLLGVRGLENIGRKEGLDLLGLLDAVCAGGLHGSPDGCELRGNFLIVQGQNLPGGERADVALRHAALLDGLEQREGELRAARKCEDRVGLLDSCKVRVRLQDRDGVLGFRMVRQPAHGRTAHFGVGE